MNQCRIFDISSINASRQPTGSILGNGGKGKVYGLDGKEIRIPEKLVQVTKTEFHEHRVWLPSGESDLPYYRSLRTENAEKKAKENAALEAKITGALELGAFVKELQLRISASKGTPAHEKETLKAATAFCAIKELLEGNDARLKSFLFDMHMQDKALPKSSGILRMADLDSLSAHAEKTHDAALAAAIKSIRYALEPLSL